jgi:hypothetical protein
VAGRGSTIRDWPARAKVGLPAVARRAITCRRSRAACLPSCSSIRSPPASPTARTPAGLRRAGAPDRALHRADACRRACRIRGGRCRSVPSHRCCRCSARCEPSTTRAGSMRDTIARSVVARSPASRSAPVVAADPHGPAVARSQLTPILREAQRAGRRARRAAPARGWQPTRRRSRARTAASRRPDRWSECRTCWRVRDRS